MPCILKNHLYNFTDIYAWVRGVLLIGTGHLNHVDCSCQGKKDKKLASKLRDPHCHRALKDFFFRSSKYFRPLSLGWPCLAFLAIFCCIFVVFVSFLCCFYVVFMLFLCFFCSKKCWNILTDEKCVRYLKSL